MKATDVKEQQRKVYNKLTSHPLQSYEWGEFRKKTGVEVVRKILIGSNKKEHAFTLTIHPIPKTPFSVGYLPKGEMPTKELLNELRDIGKQYKCVFIQLEPNVLSNDKVKSSLKTLGLKPSHRPLFTKYTFVLDLTKSEDDLLKDMHHKTRYNIRVSQRKGVKVLESNSKESFEKYLQLTEETTNRQKFYAHSRKYHQTQWDTLPHKIQENTLSSHLLTANFENETLAAWILFAFRDTLYYPYGASSSTHRDKMASNLIMWEAIRFGKKHGLKKFDMWGALGPNPDTSDPWYGFHRFKQNYGAELTEFAGSYDLILDPVLYKIYQGTDIMRWFYLRIKKQFNL